MKWLFNISIIAICLGMPVMPEPYVTIAGIFVAIVFGIPLALSVFWIRPHHFRPKVIALSLVLFIPGAHAQDTFEAIAKQCAAEINKAQKCGTCGDMWPAWTRCAVERAYGGAVPKDRLDACIQGIWQRRWNQNTCQQCGNPVVEAARCAISRAS